MEALEAILQERPQLRGGDAVKRLTVYCSKMAMNFNNSLPKTTLAAKFSIPHAMAATLVHGADEPENFFDASLSDERISALRPRIELAELPDIKPWPYDRPAKVSLELEDGSRIEQLCEAALGSPARPLGTEPVLAKIAQLSQSRAPGLHDAVVELREHLAQGQLARLNFRQWMASFYR
jgi:2-methylcitrate dehydratase PrpD